MKLSVCLAIYNEESKLEKCLESISQISDEIIIVDGGSKDRSVEIAKKFHAKVVVTSNPQLFHINKNKAIKLAKGEWVLQLDADEIVTPELGEEIKKTISSESNLNGYWIPRSNYFLTRFLTKGGQYPDYTLRLYKNGKGILPANDVHEQATVEGETGYLAHDLLHYRDTTFDKYLNGLNRYSEFISTQLANRRQSINLIAIAKYYFLLPIFWFLKAYIRHRGYVDGLPGLIFAYFSSLRFPIAFTKYWCRRTSPNPPNL